jgi:hypothetical protein
MKNGAILFFLLALFLAFGAVPISAQEESHITVRNSELNNGVVILNVPKESKA